MSIKEEMSDAPKTTKVYAKNIQAPDAVDPYSDGPGGGRGWRLGLSGPAPERESAEGVEYRDWSPD